jgi:hypothetical protein
MIVQGLLRQLIVSISDKRALFVPVYGTGMGAILVICRCNFHYWVVSPATTELFTARPA